MAGRVSNPGAPSVAARDVNKIIVNVGHFDVWDYGTNFFNVDALFSNANEPAYAIGNGNSGGGSTEFYAVYRAQLSPDKIFGINTKFGPITAINFEIGGDAEAENTAVRARQEAACRRSELQHWPARRLPEYRHAMCRRNGTTTGIAPSSCTMPRRADQLPRDRLSSKFVWFYGLKGLVGLPMDFKGFVNIVLPKGKTGFGGQTRDRGSGRSEIEPGCRHDAVQQTA